MISRPDLFADTAGWAAVAVPSESQHAAAMAVVRQVLVAGGRFVTTNLVLAELTALLTRPLRLSKLRQIQFLADLRNDPNIEVVHIDPILDAAAWQLWSARPDKEWSLVDCASFVVMQQRGLTDALTTDHHFEQAGFVRLLK